MPAPTSHSRPAEPATPLQAQLSAARAAQRSGRPHPTTLVGELPVALGLWRDWARSADLEPVCTSARHAGELFAELLSPDPHARVCALLRQPGSEHSESQDVDLYGAPTELDLQAALDARFAEQPSAPLARLCQAILQAGPQASPETLATSDTLEDTPIESILSAAAALRERPVAILLAASNTSHGSAPQDPSPQNHSPDLSQARLLVSLSESIPQLCIAWSCSAALCESILSQPKLAWISDRLHPHAIKLAAADRPTEPGPQEPSEFSTLYTAQELENARQAIRQAQVSSEANRASTSSQAAQDPDGARSAAESFLFAVLERHPATKGAFELNADPGFDFPPGRPAEIDLLARRHRLAIEIDGYFHFREAADFRRDRRKDLLLQEHGYLIARFLAEDVVSRLEEVLSTILRLLTPNNANTPRASR
jgi:hypothetical protein